MIKINSIKVIDFSNRLILSLSAIVTICILGWLLYYSRYGFDFTDESYYLVWMSNPFQYSVSTTQFEFIYHPFYQLLNGNIAALRQTNILITFFLAWMLSSIFIKTVYCNQSIDRSARLIVSAAIGIASFAFFRPGISTPSYNSLALQALLIVTIGLLLADKKISRASIIGWVLMGIGGWLAFMAKPTTSVALGFLLVLYLLIASKLNLRLLAISLSIAVGFFVLSAFTIDGSIIAFIDRLKGGAEAARIQDGGYTLGQLLRLDNFSFEKDQKRFLIYSTAVFFFTACFFQARIKILFYGGIILSIVFALVSLAIIYGFSYKIPGAGQFQGLLLWSVPFAAILVGFAIYRFKGFAQITRPQWALALSFLVLPHVYAFGTNNNYWAQGSYAVIFWVLAGLIFLAPVSSNGNLKTLMIFLGLAVQLVTIVIVRVGIEVPYRQPQPLHKNNCEMDIGNPGSTLILSKEFGQYVKDAISVATRVGFKKGTPMIDLSGQSPGILYALGASSIGQPWMVGGYLGSDNLAIKMLKRVSCEKLSRAWLLLEPEGPRKISPEVLSSFGANLATDFEIAGTFKTAEGAGGYKEVRVQQLLKPIRYAEDAMIACSAARTSME